METATARKLSYTLRRAQRMGLHLRADIEGNRIVFSGGKKGSHSLDISVSSEERVLAHWDGYCENNGLPRPVEGQKVFFTGDTGKKYLGTVTKVGTKRVYLDFKYRHGGAGRTNVLISKTIYA